MQVMGPDDDTGYKGSWWEAKVLARKPTAGGGHIYTIEYSEVGLRGGVTLSSSARRKRQRNLRTPQKPPAAHLDRPLFRHKPETVSSHACLPVQ